jgi:hypothetical protein
MTANVTREYDDKTVTFTSVVSGTEDPDSILNVKIAVKDINGNLHSKEFSGRYTNLGPVEANIIRYLTEISMFTGDTIYSIDPAIEQSHPDLYKEDLL